MHTQFKYTSKYAHTRSYHKCWLMYYKPESFDREREGAAAARPWGWNDMETGTACMPAVWHDSFMCVTWLILTCVSWLVSSPVRMIPYGNWYGMYACSVTWLIHVCDVTHSHMSNLTSEDETTWKMVWHICLQCDMTHSCVWYDSFLCVTWLIHVWYDSFICVSWLIHMCDMTHSHVWCESIMRVTWLILICVHWLVRMKRYATRMAYMSAVWHNS